MRCQATVKNTLKHEAFYKADKVILPPPQTGCLHEPVSAGPPSKAGEPSRHHIHLLRVCSTNQVAHCRRTHFLVGTSTFFEVHLRHEAPIDDRTLLPEDRVARLVSELLDLHLACAILFVILVVAVLHHRELLTTILLSAGRACAIYKNVFHDFE